AALSNNGSQSQQPKTDRERKPRISTGKAVLLGAGLMAAGEALVRSRGREALDSVRHTLAEKLDGRGDEDYEDEPEDVEDEEYDDEEEEPARKPRRKTAGAGRGRK